ncbi:hypothetical protein D9M73_204180 [compost metagenome]
MVGASRISLTPSREMASSMPCGVKLGSTTWVPPLMNSAVIAAKSARWNIGIECRNTVSSAKRPAVREAVAEKNRLLWLSITPFGKPVVPPV